MAEESAISRRTIAGSAGLAPSLAKGNPETAALDERQLCRGPGPRLRRRMPPTVIPWPHQAQGF
jgi:hypothetical protein